MRTRILSIAFVVIVFFLGACGNDKTSVPTLPSGCSSPNGVYAYRVVASDLQCLPVNAFTDVDEVLGAPDGAATGPGKTEMKGILSLGINGSVTVFMGSCIQDQAGPDLWVYQSVAREAVEVQVSGSPDGPFVSLGTTDCNDPPPYFQGHCEFDLAGSGLNNVRFVKVIDREQQTYPGAECDNAGMSPGADIDAIQVVHPVE
jgi:hypothetical protein